MASRDWTEADFDLMSWHDDCVHGLRILEGGDSGGEFWLDLDYILEWLGQVDNSFRYRVAPAILKFRDVFGLRILLDYATPTAGLTPFSIDHIERESIGYGNNYRSYKWKIAVNWPNGEITFESPGFHQQLTGPVVESGAPLAASERPGGKSEEA